MAKVGFTFDGESKLCFRLVARTACVVQWGTPTRMLRSDRILFGVNAAEILVAVGVEGIDVGERAALLQVLSGAARHS